MPIIGNDYQPPSNLPTGLVLGGQGPVVPRPPQREPSLAQLLSIPVRSAAAMADIPRQAAFAVGPALVGRAGEGPSTGSEALQRAGLDYDVPWQRALGHGAGVGLDMLANPLGLMGMGGAGRAAGAGRTAGAAEGALARRLEQFAGQGLGDTLAARPATATLPQLEWGTRSVPNAPFSARSPFSPGVPAEPGPIFPSNMPSILRGPRPGFNPDLSGSALINRRLGQFAGSGLEDAAMAARARATQQIPAQPGSEIADIMRRMSADRPALAGPAGPAGGAGAPSPGMSPQFLRPALPPGTNPGSTILDPNTLVSVPPGGFPNFPQSLTTNPAATNPVMDRLARMSGRVPQAPATPATPSFADASTWGSSPAMGRGVPLSGPSLPDIPGLSGVSEARLGLPRAGQTQPLGDIERFLQRSVPDVPLAPRSMADLSARTGTTPGPSPASSGPTLGDMWAGQGAQPRAEYSPDQYRAFWEAMQNPGRGNTLGPRLQTIVQPPPGTDPFMPSGRPPYRPPTNGPIDY